MTKQNKFKDQISGSLRVFIIDEIVEYILLNHEEFENIYTLIDDTQTNVSWRAAWICEKIIRKHPEFLHNKQRDLINKLSEKSHSGTRRLLLSILYDLPVAEPFPVDLLEFCFEHMLASDEPIAIQTLCIKIAHKLCLKEPELLPELRLYLQSADTEYYSAGVKSCIRRTLKKITYNI